MQKKYILRWQSLFILFSFMSAFFLAGCQAYSIFSDRAVEDYRDWKDTDTDLVKRVLIGSLEVKTFYSAPEINTKITHALIGKLSQKRYEVFSVGHNGIPQEVWQSLTPSQQKTDSIALATVARQYGLTAFVRYGFDDVRTISKSSGVLWFRKVKYLAEVQFFVEVYDAETGTKLFDEIFMFDQTLLGRDDYEELQNEKIVEIPNFDKLIQKLGSQMGSAIVKTLNKVYWKGYVSSATDSTVVFTGGAKSGFSAGKKLGVYATRKSAVGKSGFYYRPGDLIGEIQITAVFPDRIEAKILSGKDIQIGDTVRRTSK